MWSCENWILLQPNIQGGPGKKTERPYKFPQYVDTITGIYEVTPPENNDTKISHFGSVVYFHDFLGHILWDNVDTPNFPFSA